MTLNLVGALLFLLVIIIFTLQNNTLVSIQFINWKSSEISLAVVVLISACSGALITFMLASYRALKTGQRLRKLMNLNRKYEKEIEILKGKESTNKEEASDNNI